LGINLNLKKGTPEQGTGNRQEVTANRSQLTGHS
jgi:hypothetical protein